MTNVEVVTLVSTVDPNLLAAPVLSIVDVVTLYVRQFPMRLNRDEG